MKACSYTSYCKAVNILYIIFKEHCEYINVHQAPASSKTILPGLELPGIKKMIHV